MQSRLITQTVACLALAFCALTGCSSMPGMPGNIKESTSTFDNSIELSMQPAFVFRTNDGFSGSDLRLALFWRSSMRPGDLVVEVYVRGAESFSTGKSLHFNVDGQIISYASIDELTDIQFKPGSYRGVYIPATNISSKRYLINRQFLDRLLSAHDVRVRLDLRKSFVEGIFSDDTPSSARRAFKEFSEKLAQRRQ